MKNVHLINQHIYITSDEEIKEGDFFYVKTSNIHGGNIVTKCLNLGKGCWSEHILTDKIDEKGYHPSHCKKIILTTDPDLIKDGVQPIGDEFLEWFVKNPTCEYVEIKQPFTPSSIVYGINTNLYKIIIPQEEAPEISFANEIKQISDYDKGRWYGRLEGAKWQAERMYSEEEVIELLWKYHLLMKMITN